LLSFLHGLNSASFPILNTLPEEMINRGPAFHQVVLLSKKNNFLAAIDGIISFRSYNL